MTQPTWTSRMAFILTASSFAVGLGNIWRFPYMVGTGGGGAFLLIYLLLAFGIGFPILLAELSLGRISGSSPLLGFSKLSGRKEYNLIGWVSVFATFLILGFYVMIMSWICIYFYHCLSGQILGISENSQAHFNTVTGHFWANFLIGSGITLFAFFIIKKGLKNGVEALAKIFMPILFLLIVVLGIWSCTRSGAWEGISWYLTPNWSNVSMDIVLGALSQIFFSVGIGMTAVFVFGSYSTKKQDIISDAALVIIVDTAVAFLAGFVIFPVLFSFEIAPDSGPSLLFNTMTKLLAEMPMGVVFGGLFFLLLLLAGLTSVVTVMEGVSQSLKDRFAISQTYSLLICVFVTALLLIPNILSHTNSPLRDIQGKSFFGWTDMLANSVLLPLAGLGIVLFASYTLGFKRFQEATNLGSKSLRITGGWQVLFKVLIPICIIVILLYGLI